MHGLTRSLYSEELATCPIVGRHVTLIYTIVLCPNVTDRQAQVIM